MYSVSVFNVTLGNLMLQVYGSVVANRYSNQHILPLSQMSVTSECFYQPRANTDFDEEFEQLELSKNGLLLQFTRL